MCNVKPAELKNMDKKGVFICIEGLDGSGKTTQAKILARKLGETTRAVYTAEPSNGKIGMFIRESCLYDKKRLPSSVEALLFAADRVEHIQNEVTPALEEGKIVICDRYVYSSLAYQGSAGLSLDWIKSVNEYALKPDVAFFIDARPEIAMQRLNRGRSVMETLENQRKVRQVYLRFVENGELCRLDGEKPLSAVAEDLYLKVANFLKQKR